MIPMQFSLSFFYTANDLKEPTHRPHVTRNELMTVRRPFHQSSLHSLKINQDSKIPAATFPPIQVRRYYVARLAALYRSPHQAQSSIPRRSDQRSHTHTPHHFHASPLAPRSDRLPPSRTKLRRERGKKINQKLKKQESSLVSRRACFGVYYNFISAHRAFFLGSLPRPDPPPSAPETTTTVFAHLYFYPRVYMCVSSRFAFQA